MVQVRQTRERTLEEYAASYHELGKETATILNNLRGQGEPLVSTVERIASLGRLPFRSSKEQTFMKDGNLRRMFELDVSLPNAGEQNRYWIQGPHLGIAELLEGDETTLLQVSLEAGAGLGYQPNFSWRPNHRLQTESRDSGLVIVPDYDMLTFTTESLWADTPVEATASKDHATMATLVNSLRGLVGGFEER